MVIIAKAAPNPSEAPATKAQGPSLNMKSCIKFFREMKSILDTLQEISLKEEDREYLVRTECKGTCSSVWYGRVLLNFQAADTPCGQDQFQQVCRQLLRLPFPFHINRFTCHFHGFQCIIGCSQ